MTSTDKAANEQINGIRISQTQSAARACERAHCIAYVCAHACMPCKPQTLTACKIVRLCRERDVRRRCMWPRHDDAHHVDERPRVCDIHGKNMNRQKRANGIRMSQTQKRACACERAHACVMCACVRMPSHRPQTLTACEIVCSCVESVMMGGADVAETRRRASCGTGPVCV